ncbi:YhcN/YlaJ family sporulation lipoprotein [Bacillus sp. FJAT-27445]|uniref:YhcN/YlaJ family sporulation lipoprotein n=1 Tax=Bacillus sp. FJAT-27445 TaxID=1679166 RepID=UPI000743673D|nr:YhcN/YlaJ family sporulation lipoprotein [Bacillus sp. FJAT-27445]
MAKLLIITSFLLILAGCGTNGLDGTRNTHKQNVTVKNSVTPDVDRKTGSRSARHLENLASTVPNVRGANAVVLGKYAIVGIDIDADTERSEAGVIKYSVVEALKEDPNGARAMVVADPDINARLKELSSDIKNGQPIQGIMYELADIAGRIIPEVPGKIVQPDPNRPLNEPNRQLNGRDRKELEQRQEEESLRKK